MRAIKTASFYPHNYKKMHMGILYIKLVLFFAFIIGMNKHHIVFNL